jgi:hypothetical protein
MQEWNKRRSSISLDGLADFLNLLRNDPTRIAIRGLVILGGAYQFFRLADSPIVDIVPAWALEIFDFFTVVFGLYVGAIVIVAAIFALIGTVFLSNPLRNQKIGIIQQIIALIATSILIFQFEQISRFFALIGLICYLIYDINNQIVEMTEKNPSGESEG